MNIKFIFLLFLTFNLALPLGFIPFSEAQSFYPNGTAIPEPTNESINDLVIPVEDDWDGATGDEMGIPEYNQGFLDQGKAFNPDRSVLIESGVDYFKWQNWDNSITYETHYPYVFDGINYVPTIVRDEPTVTQIEFGKGKLVFDKIGCAVTYFDDLEDIVINSDSYVVRTATIDTDDWTSLAVNDLECEIVTVQQDDGFVVSIIKENNEGIFEVEYVIDKGVKTTAKFTNQLYDNNKFAFSQTLELPDNEVVFNNQVIDLGEFQGMSFDRTVLEDNEDMILSMKEVNFNAGLGFDQLWSVNLYDGKIAMDYGNQGENKIAVGETLELDPTVSFSKALGNFVTMHASALHSNVSYDAWGAYQSGSYRAGYQADLSALPSGAPVTAMSWTSTSTAYYSGSCSSGQLKSMSNSPEYYKAQGGSSASAMIGTIQSGSGYGGSQYGNTASTHTFTDNFNTSALAVATNAMGTGGTNGGFWWGIDGCYSFYGMNDANTTFSLTYNPLLPPQNLTASQTDALQVFLDWDGATSGDTPTGYKIYQVVGGVDYVLVADTGNTDTDFEVLQDVNGSTLSLGTTYEFKVSAIDSTNESALAGPVSQTVEILIVTPANFDTDQTEVLKIDADWDDHSVGDTPTGYNIYEFDSGTRTVSDLTDDCSAVYTNHSNFSCSGGVVTYDGDTHGQSPRGVSIDLGTTLNIDFELTFKHTRTGISQYTSGWHLGQTYLQLSDKNVDTCIYDTPAFPNETYSGQCNADRVSFYVVQPHSSGPCASPYCFASGVGMADDSYSNFENDNNPYSDGVGKLHDSSNGSYRPAQSTAEYYKLERSGDDFTFSVYQNSAYTGTPYKSWTHTVPSGMDISGLRYLNVAGTSGVFAINSGQHCACATGGMQGQIDDVNITYDYENDNLITGIASSPTDYQITQTWGTTTQNVTPFEDDFTTDVGWSHDGSNTSVNTTTGVFEFGGSGNDILAHKELGFTLDDDFIIQWAWKWNSGYDGNGLALMEDPIDPFEPYQKWIGIFQSNSQGAISLGSHAGAGGWNSNTAKLSTGSGDCYVSSGTWIYPEIVKTENSFTATVYSDNTYQTSICSGTMTFTTPAYATGYNEVSIWSNWSNNSWDSDFDDIRVMNGCTTFTNCTETIPALVSLTVNDSYTHKVSALNEAESLNTDYDGTASGPSSSSETAINGVGSLDFDGSNDYVSLSQSLSNALDTTSIQSGMSSAWTVSLWAYVENLSGDQNTYLSKIESGYVDHELNLRQSGSNFQFGGAGIAGSYNQTPIAHTGWTNIILSVTGIGTSTITTTMYVDDGSGDTDTLTATPKWNNSGETLLYSGQQGNLSSERPMSGQLQEVAFWNIELSADDREDIFNGYDHSTGTSSSNTGAKANTVATSNLIAYYTYDNGDVTNQATETITYESDLSSPTSWTLQDDLPAPTNLTAQSGIPIQLDWDDVANAVSYQVYRDSGSGFTLLANAGSDSDYDDSSTVAGNSYDYKVSALGPSPANLLESALSSQVTATAGQPPDAITTVTATISNAQTDPHVVTLTWGEPSDWQTGTPQSYEVFESVGSSGNMQSVSSALTYVAGTFTHTHNISGIQPLTDYYYMVRATSTHGTSGDSNIPYVTTVDVPVKPDTPVATQPDTNATPYIVNLSWSDNGDGGSDIKGHQIDRWDSNSNAWTTIVVNDGLPSASTYQDTSIVSPAIDVRYKIGVINGVGVSTLSDQSNTITIPDVPLVPNNVSCTTDSSTEITVTWQVPTSDGGSALTSYSVYRPHPSNEVQLATNVYSYQATGLTSGTLYQFDVLATNNVGDGSYASCTATTSIAPAGTFSITQDWIVYDTMEVSYLAVVSAGNPSPTVEDIKIKLDGTTVATVPVGSQVSIGQQLTGTLQIKLPDLVQHDLTADMRMTNTGNEVTVTSNTLSVIATFLPTYKEVVEGTGLVAWDLTRDETQTELNIEIFKDTAPFNVNCALLTPEQASKTVDKKITSMDSHGIGSTLWQNATSVGYHNATSTVNGNLSYYVFCYEQSNPYLLMFSDVSYSTLGSALASGLSGLEADLGLMLGGPLISIFVVMLAGQATGRTAPTFIILVLVAVGILMGLGFFVIDEAIWGLILIMGSLGVLVGKKFL